MSFSEFLFSSISFFLSCFLYDDCEMPFQFSIVYVAEKNGSDKKKQQIFGIFFSIDALWCCHKNDWIWLILFVFPYKTDISLESIWKYLLFFSSINIWDLLTDITSIGSHFIAKNFGFCFVAFLLFFTFTT